MFLRVKRAMILKLTKMSAMMTCRAGERAGHGTYGGGT
jgi:hypothetical protein